MDKILLNKILNWLDSNINKDNYLDNKEIQEALSIDSSELKEKIHEDLLCLTDEYLIDELDGYEVFDDKICQIIVDNFNKFNDNGL